MGTIGLVAFRDRSVCYRQDIRKAELLLLKKVIAQISPLLLQTAMCIRPVNTGTSAGMVYHIKGSVLGFVLVQTILSHHACSVTVKTC